MGNSANSGLGAKSTAVDVLKHFGEGKEEMYLTGLVAVVTGSLSAIVIIKCNLNITDDE